MAFTRSLRAPPNWFSDFKQLSPSRKGKGARFLFFPLRIRNSIIKFRDIGLLIGLADETELAGLAELGAGL